MLSPQGFVDQKVQYRVAGQENSQLLPHSEESERAVLGGLLIDPDQMIDVGYLKSSDFFITNYGLLYGVMQELYQAHTTYDMITVSDEMEKRGLIEDFGGAGAILDLQNSTPTAMHTAHYAKIIHSDSIRRQTLQANQKIAQLAYDRSLAAEDLINAASQEITNIDATTNTEGAKPTSSGVNKFLDKLEFVQKHGSVAGLPTGIKAIDRTLGGFKPKKFYLLAGRPGMGKSSLALQFAHNVAKTGKRVLIFSLEMPEEDQIERLISQESGIPYETFDSPIDDTRFETAVRIATHHVLNLPITIDDTPALTMATIRNVAQREGVKNGLDLIIIDHMNLIRSTSEGSGDSTYETTQIANDGLAICKQVGVPVLALVQLNRSCEARANKRPLQSDLRGTGAWEQNADGVMFVYRDGYYNDDTEFPNVAEIIIAKNRGGKTGTASVYTKMPTAQFVDLEIKTEPLDY